MIHDYEGSGIDLDGRTILITGGTGSFGQAFLRTILRRFKPKKVIVLSRDEFKQFELQHDPEIDPKITRFFIGDVRDRDRLRVAFRGVDYVVHAAALKHIATAEYNPFECIQTNVQGAENVVLAALDAGVKRVIALSTDKAANPANLYGASKLASDKIFVAAKSIVGRGDPRFAVVRYGNVLGSRGSVVPFFQKLIDEGTESLPITDERMTRFWITLQQGVDFVLSCLQRMQGGEIFVPKIPSMSVVDLARTLGPDIPLRFIGMRSGEKLHETMITSHDARHTVDAGDRYIIRSPNVNWYESSEKETPVAEDFQYSSDENEDWLDAETLRTLLR